MERNLKPKTIVEIFKEAFPVYLAMGMTYREFWELDSSLVIAYRKAYQIKQEESNNSAWLQGLYFLQALQSGVPVFLNGIMKTKVDLPEFPQKPIPFSKDGKKKQEEDKMKLQVARMKAMAEQFNATFAKKQGTK